MTPRGGLRTPAGGRPPVENPKTQRSIAFAKEDLAYIKQVQKDRELDSFATAVRVIVREHRATH